MSVNDLGAVPASTIIYLFWTSHDLATGANETMSALALADILIYKNGSITQRSSTAGFTLLDTDGIDFDALTGVNGISIDLSDNTDAGFYAAGSWYTVIVGPITIDVQTVYINLATFRIVAAENTSGTPVIDVGRVGGTAQTAGDIMADTNDIQARLPAALVGGRVDASVGAMAADVVTAAAIAAAAIDAATFAAGAIDAAAIATGAIDADALAADAVAEIADGVWDEDATGHQTLGTYGQAIGDPVADTNTIYKAVVSDAAGATVGVDVVAVQADIDNIQTRLPAALVGGKMDADATALSGDATAADRLEALMDGVIVAQVNDAGATATVFIADGFTEATNDHFNGRLITFITGALAGQQTDITDYVGATQTFTVTAMTEAPANNDYFVVT